MYGVQVRVLAFNGDVGASSPTYSIYIVGVCRDAVSFLNPCGIKRYSLAMSFPSLLYDRAVLTDSLAQPPQTCIVHPIYKCVKLRGLFCASLRRSFCSYCRCIREHGDVYTNAFACNQKAQGKRSSKPEGFTIDDSGAVGLDGFIARESLRL